MKIECYIVVAFSVATYLSYKLHYKPWAVKSSMIIITSAVVDTVVIILHRRITTFIFKQEDPVITLLNINIVTIV